MHKYPTLDPALLAGKTVIDVMNYWAPIDGEIDDLKDDPRSTSEVIQAFLPDATVVKTLNHIGYHELEEDGRAPGSPDRRALAIATDSPGAGSMVAEFIDRLGFDPVDAGPLAAGRAFQPGTAIFTGTQTADTMRALLEQAREPVGV